MPAQISPELLDAIATVESGGNPNAINPRTFARGAYQFMPIGWKDVVQNYPQLNQYADYNRYALDPNVSRVFAQRLLELNAKRLKDRATIENLLASYNYGVGNVMAGRPLPTETINYIKKVKDAYTKNIKNKQAKELVSIFGLKEKNANR